MKKILSLFFSLLTISLFSQELSKIIPPSPNAASLGIYGDIPVSKYTGIPNISVPIHTIKSGSIELPITLNYHASGIKVAQEASWVGLGWSLNAGGLITRQVRDKDDFDTKGYIGVPDNTPDPISPYSGQQNWEYYNFVDGTGFDTEPDYFYYNFMGLSGKLLFEKQSGNIVKAISVSDNNIDFSYNKAYRKWEVTDGNGWKYYLGTKEIIRSFANTYDTDYLPEYEWLAIDPHTSVYGIPSSWYLDKIVTPNGDEITFTYDASNNASVTQVSHSDKFMKRTDPGGACPPEFSPGQFISRFSRSMQEIRDVYLEKITFKNGYIDFNASYRDDIRVPDYNTNTNSNSWTKPKKLQNIEVFNTDNTLIKKVNLDYSYYNQQYVTPTTVNPQNTLRLRLDEVKEQYLNPETNVWSYMPPYAFNYDDHRLPDKTSYSVDHWGYFNGKDNMGIQHPYNSHYINMLTPRLLSQSGNEIFRGANREPDVNKMLYGMLESITYPTGGITEFNFGTHSREVIGGYVNKNALDFPGGSAPADDKTEEFILTQTRDVKLDFSFTNNSYGVNGTENIYNLSVFDNLVATLEDVNGNAIITFSPDENIQTYFETQEVTLLAGTYRLVVNSPTDKAFYVNLSAQYWDPTINSGTMQVIGSGANIESISYKDNDNSLIKKTEYSYEDENGYLSHRLLSQLNYNSISIFRIDDEAQVGIPISIMIVHAPGVFLCGETYDVRSSSNAFSMATSGQGAQVTNDFVTVSNVDSNGNNLGSIKYYYKNKEEYSYVGNHYTNLPNYVHLDNGQLIKEEVRNASNVLVKKREISYKKETEKRIKGIKFYNDFTPGREIEFGDIKIYYLRSEWWHPETETETIYDLNGNNPVTTNTAYEYSNIDHKQITKVTTVNSKDQVITTTNKYPQDYPVTSNLDIDKMVEYNIINPVLESQIKLNDNVISTTLTEYNNWGPNANQTTTQDLLLPKLVKTAKGSASLKNRLVYHEYYDNGNIKEVSKEDGVSIVYVWGYNQEYPIAKIDNVTFTPGKPNTITNAQQTLINNAVTATVNETTQITEDNLRTKLQLLRDGFPNAIVSTYTYDPLIGITSTTDPKGYTMYYEYDIFNRLEHVKDKDGNILSRNEYNYANQN